LGDIVDGEARVSKIGKIVESEWINTPCIRPDMNLQLGDHVVMPNHFHGIIIIGNNEYNCGRRDAMPRVFTADNSVQHDRSGRDAMLASVRQQNSVQRDGSGRDAMHRVSTMGGDSVPWDDDRTDMAAFGPQSKNLASIIRGFKSSVTRNARCIYSDFAWQSGFHEHVIRDEHSYKKISEYIIDNAANWRKDEYYL
jgi:REP element-mobilizing transposase RayT